MKTELNWTQQGWECPKCGAVMSPTTSCCVNCRGNKGGGVATTQPSIEPYKYPSDATNPYTHELDPNTLPNWVSSVHTGEYPEAYFDVKASSTDLPKGTVMTTILNAGKEKEKR